LSLTAVGRSAMRLSDVILIAVGPLLSVSRSNVGSSQLPHVNAQ
jgi:hypothetical protein